MADKTHFNYQIIDKLLCTLFVESTLFNITFNININKCGDSSDTVSRTVLLLNCTEITKIQPLNCLMCIFRRAGNIASVLLCHGYKVVHKFELTGNIFNQPDCIISHIPFADTFLISLTLFNKIIHSVKCNTAVVTYNSSAAICIGKPRKYSCMAGFPHRFGINTEYTCVMRGTVSELILYMLSDFITVGLTCLNCVSVTGKGINGSFKRLIGLQTYN